MFLPTGNCISRVAFLRQTACPKGWSLLSNLLPSLLLKLQNLVPSPQPRVQPNLLPRWQPSLQPSLQLESRSLWPLLSMCSSSRSNSYAKIAGTQSLSLRRAEHSSQQAVSGSFCGTYALMSACLVSCGARPLNSSRGAGQRNRHLGYVPSGVQGYRCAQVLTI